MVHRGTAIARLRKVHVERLLGDYDTDPIVALTHALRVVLETPDASWAMLLAAAPIDAGRRHGLLSIEEAALDQLAAELNERRGFDEHPEHKPAYRPAVDSGSARSSDTQPR